MEREVSEYLRDHKLRSTGCRTEVLSIFMDKDIALSQADLEKQLSVDHDRVTIYRTLKTFLDHGILHKVLDDAGAAKYALCKEPCTQKVHHHEHVHFKCIICDTTICLEDLDVPQIRLPEKYIFKEANFLVQGICENCNQTK